jgi:L-alanine-DL-glutamate epimerase-like enolase superfamily enzyme
MKITEVTSTILKSYEYPHGGWVLVRVKADEGLEGIGECFVPDQHGQGVLAAQAVLEGSLKRVVIGEDPLDIEVIWEKMYAVCRSLYDRRGLAIHALSGVDMALYDLAGKALGVPVHKLLGGRFRDKVKVYVSSIWVDEERPQSALEATTRYVAQGFRAIKYYGWAGFGRNPKRDSSLLRAIREAAGEGIDLMLDLGRPASLTEAIKVARMIEASEAGIYWWEEPLCSSDDAEGLARLAASTDITIAAGEREMTAFGFRDLILKRAVDLLQPDLSWVGGLTEGKRIAEMARLFNVPLVPHNWGTMVNFAASVHLVASMPQGFLCEYPITPRTPEARIASPMMTELVRTPLAIENGYAVVPTKPGLGIELDEEAVGKYTWAA